MIKKTLILILLLLLHFAITVCGQTVEINSNFIYIPAGTTITIKYDAFILELNYFKLNFEIPVSDNVFYQNENKLLNDQINILNSKFDKSTEANTISEKLWKAKYRKAIIFGIGGLSVGTIIILFSISS